MFIPHELALYVYEGYIYMYEGNEKKTRKIEYISSFCVLCCLSISMLYLKRKYLNEKAQRKIIKPKMNVFFIRLFWSFLFYPLCDPF